MTWVDTWSGRGEGMREEGCDLLLWTSLAVKPVCAETFTPGKPPGGE